MSASVLNIVSTSDAVTDAPPPAAFACVAVIGEPETAAIPAEVSGSALAEAATIASL